MVGSDDETQSREPRESNRPRERAGRLRVVHPPGLAGVTVPLGARSTVVGRHDSATVVVQHPTVSREHVRIEATASGWNVRDLGSHNGSSLGGADLSEIPRALVDQDVLRLGDVLFVVELGAAHDDAVTSPEAVFGQAPVMAELRRRVARAGTDAAPVLVTGDTGVGKERVAEELHRLSGRTGPLVKVNCGAIAHTLFESQLFGHVRGAFTGADTVHAGLFVAADGGSLLFDELGELPLDLQPKLLRVVQDGEVWPVGDAKPRRVDVRIIGSTNRDLDAAVGAGMFRRDLLARLSTWRIEIPPLARRRGDVLAWVGRLGDAWRSERGLAPLTLTSEAAEALLLADWPDNLRAVPRLVRELEEAELPIPSEALPAWLSVRGATESPHAARRSPSRDELETMLREEAGSVRAVAKRLGRDRRQIYRWLETYGLGDARASARVTDDE